MRFHDIQPFVRFASLIRFAKNAGGQSVAARDCRLFYLYSGSARVETGNREYDMKPGCCIYIPAGSPYRLVFPEVGDSQMFIVNFDFDRQNSDQKRAFPPMDFPAAEEVFQVPALEDAPFFACSIFVEQAQALEGIFMSMEREHGKSMMFSEKLVSAYLTEALSVIARAQISEDIRHPQAIETMIRFIRENIKQQIRNRDVAAAVSYHPNYANYLFLKHTGQTIHQYLIDCRVQKALELLLSTELSITEIALEAGFSGINRFSKEFSARTGSSPGKYRKRI